MAEGCRSIRTGVILMGLHKGTGCIRVAAGRGIRERTMYGEGDFLLHDATTTDLTRCKFYAPRKKIPSVMHTLSFISR